MIERTTGNTMKMLMTTTAIAAMTLTALNMYATDTAFGLNLFKNAAPRGTDNVAISPNSVATALALLETGANGVTAAELRNALGAENISSDELTKQFTKFRTTITEISTSQKGRITLENENSAWMREGLSVRADYFERVKKAFGAVVETIPMDQSGEKRINNWTSERTRGRIKEIIPQNTLNQDSCLILVNTVYFKGDWDETFEESDTFPQTFYAPDGEIMVKMMHQTTDYMLAEFNGFSVLEANYRGGDVAMGFILPDKKDGLPEIEKKINPTLFTNIADKAKLCTVCFSLPRFKVGTSGVISLKPALTALGIRKAFDENADFSRITSNPNDAIFLSDILHNAVVEVSERGTEAAAATAAIMRCLSLAPNQENCKKFTLDHPFLFYLFERRSGEILFIGRVVKP